MPKSTHSAVEDLFALVSAGLFVAFGLYLFQSQNLLIGGVAGLTLLGTHVVPVSFGVLFFALNAPFYILAWTHIGKRFTINTFVSVTTVSLLSEVLPHLVSINQANPIFTAVFGGILIGVGMLIMFRHTSSLGGLGILAYFLQSKTNIRAGTFQLSVDIVIMCLALLLMDWHLVIYSVVAAFCLNMVLSLNHRPERYQLPHRQKPEVKHEATTSHTQKT